MRKAVLLIASVAFAQTPHTMTKIVVRLSGAGIRPGSYAALPRTIYVANPHYARIEEPPDTRLGVEKLVIIAEPDAYNVNLIAHTGTHAIDQGGPNDLHLPIILPFDPKHKLGILDRLEFGSEVDFFDKAGATEEAGPIVNGKPADKYVLHVPNGSATLVVTHDQQKPVTITWVDGDGAHTYEYSSYQDLPFDPALFQKPAAVHFREMPVDDGSENG